MAVDLQGNVYIGEAGNNIVRVIPQLGSVSGRMTSIVAGNRVNATSLTTGLATSMPLASPKAIAVDQSGNLYIRSGDVVRYVSASTGIISTAVGSSLTGQGGAGGPATSVRLSSTETLGLSIDLLGNLYIAASGSNTIMAMICKFVSWNQLLFILYSVVVIFVMHTSKCSLI